MYKCVFGMCVYCVGMSMCINVYLMCVCVCVLCRNVMCINVYLMCVCVCVCIVYESLCV